jgi:hypothetical protein
MVTDINLGHGPSGWDVAKRARELNRAVTVIYVTSAGGHDWQRRAFPIVS